MSALSEPVDRRDPACWVCGQPDHDPNVKCEDGPVGAAYRAVMTAQWSLAYGWRKD